MRFHITRKEARRLYRNERRSTASWFSQRAGFSVQKKEFEYSAFCERLLCKEPLYPKASEPDPRQLRKNLPSAVRTTVQSFENSSDKADSNTTAYKISIAFSLLVETILSVPVITDFSKVIANTPITFVMGFAATVFGAAAAFSYNHLRAIRKKKFRGLSSQIEKAVGDALAPYTNGQRKADQQLVSADSPRR